VWFYVDPFKAAEHCAAEDRARVGRTRRAGSAERAENVDWTNMTAQQLADYPEDACPFSPKNFS
jgi:hypothetical protein